MRAPNPPAPGTLPEKPAPRSKQDVYQPVAGSKVHRAISAARSAGYRYYVDSEGFVCELDEDGGNKRTALRLSSLPD